MTPTYALVGRNAASGTPAPALTSVNHDVADKAGGSAITITGTNLGSATLCTVSGTSATITGNTSTTLTFTMPAKAAGTHSVQVTTAGGASNTLTIEAWSPVDQPLSVLLRPPFLGTPWTGTASAGTSGSRNAAETTNPPSIGSAVNGFNPADFDGANDLLTIGGTIDDIYGSGSSSYAGVALVFIDSIGTDNGLTKSSNDSIVASVSSGRAAVYLRSSGGGTAYVFHYDAGGLEPIAQVVVGTGAWKLLHWKFDGTNLRIGVNGAWGSAVPAGAQNGSNSPFTMALAQSTNLDNWADEKFLEFACMKGGVISDADLTKWRKYANAKYGLSLA